MGHKKFWGLSAEKWGIVNFWGKKFSVRKKICRFTSPAALPASLSPPSSSPPAVNVTMTTYNFTQLYNSRLRTTMNEAQKRTNGRCGIWTHELNLADPRLAN